MPVNFGTSGLRAAATEFDARTVAAYVSAFLTHIASVADTKFVVGSDVFVGSDLRASSPTISSLVIATIVAEGFAPRWCGVLPTPALAAAALDRHVPAIMITGSHIPETYNGIKFYRPDGELLKDDEAPIRERATLLIGSSRAAPVETNLPPSDHGPEQDYRQRFRQAFGTNALSGLRLGVFEHSAAGRDLLADILCDLGAGITRFGRQERFIAVDTEALDPQSLADCAAEIARGNLDAVVSTDGDGDRPLLIGRNGSQVNGDILCALAARALGIAIVVTPLTSTSAIELSGWFSRVVRTRIGSPYVVAAMAAETGATIAGFEANGGFLLGSDLDLASGCVSRLPTRDAILPLVAVLAETRRRNIALGDLVAQLPSRVMRADRLKAVPQETSARFLSEIAISPPLRARLSSELEHPISTDLTDGVRFGLADGSIIHFRASGNAPELRAYVETGHAGTTGLVLEKIMSQLAAILSDWNNRMGHDIT